MEKRNYQRVPFQCCCQVRCGDREWAGELLDISLRGALFDLPAAAGLELGANCCLDIVLGQDSARLQFESELVHIEGEHHGFLFLSEDLETLTHLRRLLELNMGGDETMRQELALWLGVHH
ncbi:MAG: PilZ domain-containing protein [Desulfuromonadales bacterium]|nr:PilZ domain-containing protein [Desulfuromonadales bacterium]